MERIGDMTIDELRQFVIDIINSHADEGIQTHHEKRPLSEIIESMEANIIRPKSGTPSPTQLLRQDRDR